MRRSPNSTPRPSCSSPQFPSCNRRATGHCWPWLRDSLREQWQQGLLEVSREGENGGVVLVKLSLLTYGGDVFKRSFLSILYFMHVPGIRFGRWNNVQLRIQRSKKLIRILYSDKKIGRGRKLYMHYCIYNMEDIWDWHLVLLLIINILSQR